MFSPLRLAPIVVTLLGLVAAAPLPGEPTPTAPPTDTRAAPPSLFAELSGRGLTHAASTRRWSALEARLLEAGYHRRGSLTQDDGTQIALWVHSGHRSSVMVVLGDQADGTSLQVAEIAGLLRWNEVRGML